MQFSFYGHSCFAIEVGGKKLLFDPFISGNEQAKDIDINKIEADYILVSHGHADHTADLMTIAKNTGAKVVAMAEIADWVQAKGHDNVHSMNYGLASLDFGTVRMVSAMHSSSLPDGRYGGNPAGFVITTEEGNFYYAGDTCLIMDMQLIPRFASLDFAILPIGGNFTMNAEDANMAAEFVACNKVIGIHYDTWPPISIDKDKAVETFRNSGRQLILPAIGQTISL